MPSRIPPIVPTVDALDAPLGREPAAATASFRFYEELNDFIAPGRRYREFDMVPAICVGGFVTFLTAGIMGFAAGHRGGGIEVPFESVLLLALMGPVQLSIPLVFYAKGAKGTIRSEGTRNIVRAMERAGVRRLVCQSSLAA